MKFHYRNNLRELESLANDIKTFCTENKVSEKVAYSMNLCLDEILTNIISYGINNKPEESILVELTVNEHIFIAKVTDHGTPFNPVLQHKEPDIKADIDHRPIGGLGVYFLEKYMDKIEYSRDETSNILILEKRF